MAQQLTNGKQQFLDQNGTPLAGGSVAFYSPGTMTPVNTYQDSGLSILNANPIILDSAGEAVIWGSSNALYRQIVKDSLGNTIWDQIVGNSNSSAEFLIASSAAGGSADAITATFNPPITSLSDLMGVEVRASYANATATPTFTPNFGVVPAATIVKGKNTPLIPGDIPSAGYVMQLVYDAQQSLWILLNPAYVSNATNVTGIGNAAAFDARYVLQTQLGYKPPVGTPLMWPLPTAPSWAVARDGSALSRSAYDNLFGVLCPTRNGTTDGSTNALTGLSTTVDMYVGMPIEGTGIPAGTTVASITSSSAVTMSNASTAAGTVPVTLFHYGYGSAGGSTTFGVPDDRGVFERGLDTGAPGLDTLTYACTNTSGTAVITGLTSTLGMSVGMALSGTGVAGGATILSINSATQITMSANSTSAVSSLTVNGNRIGAYSADQLASHLHSYSHILTGATYNFGSGASYGNYTNSASTGITGNAETKPKNRAYLPIIVY